MVVLILIMLVGLAAANGANDVSKGAATLAGAGVTAYRTAILWGTIATAAGALLSIQLGLGMGRLFSTGIFAGTPTNGFALAVLAGAASWVTLASIARLPVSTTHAIVGSLVGAGLVLQADSVQWNGLLPKVVIPLLLSIVVAYAISLILTLVLRLILREPPGIRSAPEEEPEPVRVPDRGGFSVINGMHWLSSAAASAARASTTPRRSPRSAGSP